MGGTSRTFRPVEEPSGCSERTSMRGRRGRWAALIALVTLAMPTLVRPSGAPPPSVSGTGFTAHTIDTGLAGGYQVVVADLNRDQRPDIIALASGLRELRWYENPGWKRHVVMDGINLPINAAVADINGDGIPEIALAHEFSNVYANSLGIVSILMHQGDPRRPWAIAEIDRVPTSHRLRFADINGTGQNVLVNFPLIGSRAVAPEYRDHVPLLMYRPGKWARETITDAEEGVVHGLAAWTSGARESLLSASFLGVHLLQFADNQWTRTRLAMGDPTAWPRSGSSEVIAGHLGSERFLATIEPWHGNTVAVYRERAGTWTRHVIDQTITDGHTIVAGDVNGDGRDELIVGERQGRRSVYLYRVANARNDIWTRQPLDDGGMAAAGCAVADLNADTRLDVVCIGSASANLKWYENQTRPRRRPPADNATAR